MTDNQPALHEQLIAKITGGGSGGTVVVLGSGAYDAIEQIAAEHERRTILHGSPPLMKLETCGFYQYSRRSALPKFSSSLLEDFS